jgi:hypothetical protein
MEAKLRFIGHGIMENRSGLIVDTRLPRVSAHAARLIALEMIEVHGDRFRAITRKSSNPFHSYLMERIEDGL